MLGDSHLASQLTFNPLDGEGHAWSTTCKRALPAR